MFFDKTLRSGTVVLVKVWSLHAYTATPHPGRLFLTNPVHQNSDEPGRTRISRISASRAFQFSRWTEYKCIEMTLLRQGPKSSGSIMGILMLSAQALEKRIGDLAEEVKRFQRRS